MSEAVARVRAAVARRDARFAEEGKGAPYSDAELREFHDALIDAAPEMLRAAEENAELKAQLTREKKRGQFDYEQAEKARTERDVSRAENARLKEQVRRLRELLVREFTSSCDPSDIDGLAELLKETE